MRIAPVFTLSAVILSAAKNLVLQLPEEILQSLRSFRMTAMAAAFQRTVLLTLS